MPAPADRAIQTMGWTFFSFSQLVQPKTTAAKISSCQFREKCTKAPFTAPTCNRQMAMTPQQAAAIRPVEAGRRP